MPLAEEIGALLEPYLENDRFFIVSLTVRPARSAHQVTILLDSDEGITIEQCASISRRLAHDIEAKELFPDAYNIEVSSPGLDQPLVLPRQYAKNIGRDLKIHLSDGQLIEGKLTELNGQELSIELPKPRKKVKSADAEPDPVRVIPLSDVTKAFIQIRFK